MNPLNAFNDPTAQHVVYRLGWVLVHSLWQGAAVALLLSGALSALRRRSPDVRYALSCGALALLAGLVVINFVLVPRFHPGPALSSAIHDTPLPTSSAGPESLAPPARRMTAGPGLPFATELQTGDPWWRALARAVEPRFPWIVGAWGLGIVLLSIYHLGGWVQVQRLRRQHTRPLGARWDRTFIQLAARLRVTRPVRLLESALVQVPAVVGWLRPVILVPASAVAGLSPKELEAILAHELAHVRRHDYLVNVLQAVVETMLFYHPAVWWISNRIRVEREDCCDDLASRACGGPLPYARALAAMEELRGDGSAQPLPRTALAATGGSLLRRIRRLTGRPAPAGPPRPGPLAAAALVLVCSLVPLLSAAIADQKVPAPQDAGNTPLAATPDAAPPAVEPPDGNVDKQLELTELYNQRIQLSRDLAEVKNKQANLKALREAGGDPPGFTEKLSADERYNSVIRKINEIQTTLDDQRLGENHPKTLAARAKMTALKQQLEDRREEIRTNLFATLGVQYEAASTAAEARLKEVTAQVAMHGNLIAGQQRIAELQGQVRRAHEEGKVPEEQIYAAQLRQAEADQDRFREQVEKESVARRYFGQAQSKSPPATAPALTVEDGARLDAIIARKVETRDRIQEDLARARETMLPTHPTVISLQKQLARVEQDLGQSAEEFRKKWVVNDGAILRRVELQREQAAAPAEEPEAEAKYYISGVPRAGAYSIAKHPVNLLQALIAGGLDVDQSRPRPVLLFRRTGAGGADRETATTLTVGDLIDHRDKDLPLKSDDMIIVKVAPPAAAAPPLVDAPPGLWKAVQDDLATGGYLDGRELSVISAYVSEDGKAAFLAIRDGRAPRGADFEAVWYRLKRVGDVWAIDGTASTGALTTAGRALETFLKAHQDARRFAKPFSVPPAASPESH